MTSSAGISGLICCGSPPSAAIASRIATRSTTHGTPVKSCISTRAGVYCDLRPVLGRRIPARPARDLVGGDQPAVLVAQQVLQQHLQAVGQPFGAVDPVQPVDLIRGVVDGEPIACAEAVRSRRRHSEPLTRRSASNLA